MTLKEHYNLRSKKHIKAYFKFILLFFLVITISQASARYTNIKSTNAVAQIAKWAITINGEQITNNTSSLAQGIDLVNVTDGTNKVDINDDCYFDIIINPATTELAVTYKVIVDLTAQTSTIPSQTIITKYEIYQGTNNQLISTSNVNNTSVTITGNIDLINNQTALASSDTRKIRVYCKLPNILNVVQNQEYKIVPTIVIEQKL